MRMSKFVLMLLILLPIKVWSGDILSLDNRCTPGLLPLDESPFSLYVSCEGALGNYAGIVMTGRWSQHGNKYWDIGNRFWYEENWGKDVTGAYFDRPTQNLYISTSGVYGKAGVYKLDLSGRKAYVLFPKEPSSVGPEDYFTIKKINQVRKLIVEMVKDEEASNLEVDLQSEEIDSK